MTGINYIRSATLAASLLVTACGQSEDTTTSSSVFVGELSTTTPTSIAVIADSASNGEAAIYLCDGISASAWFHGTRAGNTITAQAEDGSIVQATLAAGQVSGEVTLVGQTAVPFSAALANGAAGIYLVEQSAQEAKGFSATGGELQAQITNGAVQGTVTTIDGTELALAGTVKSFGETSGVATWIVQADGRVSGKVTNTAGGGNCSVWSKIRQIMSGVYCGFF